MTADTEPMSTRIGVHKKWKKFSASGKSTYNEHTINQHVWQTTNGMAGPEKTLMKRLKKKKAIVV